MEAQQLAESRCEEVLEHASSTVGTVIAVSQEVEYICKTRSKLIRTEMAHDVSHIDGRCMKKLCTSDRLCGKGNLPCMYA